MTSTALDALKTQAFVDNNARIVDQFRTDPDRLSRMSVDVCGLYIDVSKQSWSKSGFDRAISGSAYFGARPAPTAGRDGEARAA